MFGLQLGSQVKMRFDNPSGNAKEVSLCRRHLPQARKHRSSDSCGLESQTALKTQDDLKDRTWWSSVEDLGSHMSSALSDSSTIAVEPTQTQKIDSHLNSDALSPASASSALSPRSDRELRDKQRRRRRRRKRRGSAFALRELIHTIL
jgi:hypothetical protein